MKTNKKQLSLGLFTVITATTVPITTVVSCGNNLKNDASITKLNDFKEKHAQEISDYENIISKNDNDNSKIIDDKKVNLVSLGDSVSSGFTLLEGITDHHQGYYDKLNQKVSGISYGSYIARAFQEKNVLADFNNFGIAGATTATLANQIDPEFKLSLLELRDKRRRELILNPDSNFFKRSLYMQDKLKAANLITISIGANDILGNIKIAGKSIEELMANPNSVSISGGLDNLIDFGRENRINYIIEKAKYNLIHTISKIKSINHNAKILLVGYPMPINQLSPILKMAKMEKDGKRVSVANELLKMLSSISTDISKKFKSIDYVDTNVPSEWNKKSITLTSKLLDIHPGPKGYREMAAIIISELSGTRIINGRKLFKSKIHNNGDIEKRLKEDYSDIILKYSEQDKDGKYSPTALGMEGQAIQNKTKPAELVRFIAKMIDSLSKSIINTQSIELEDLNLVKYSDSGINPAKLVSTINEISPLVTTIFKSAKTGYDNSDPKIKIAVEQDLKYIFAKLTDTLIKKTQTLEEKFKPIVSALIGDESTTGSTQKIINLFYEANQYLNSQEAGKLSTFVKWLKKYPKDTEIIKDILNKGISKLNYTK